MEVDSSEYSWHAYINTFDVCITTYAMMAKDLGVAKPPAERPRRVDVLYSNTERIRSPLVACDWWRVIMDEVQMVAGGKTESVIWLVCLYIIVSDLNAREIVSLIPRRSSFAVSGTPARSAVVDLSHVLKSV